MGHRLAYGMVIVLAAMILQHVLIASGTPTQPVTPLSTFNSSIPVPVGIASYGLYNISDPLSSYRIATNGIVGFARIDALSAYNATPPANTSRYGATIQLNVVMNMTTFDGRHYSYWLQDVIDMNTSNMTYTIGDNIWNFTTLIANMSNTTVSGQGNVTPPTATDPYSANFTPGIYIGGFNSTYSLRVPTYFIPIVRVTMQGSRPVVNFGYMGNGSQVFYDNVTFNVSAVSAYLLVTPDYLTPVGNSSTASQGNYYDAELTIGGEGSGEISNFSRANVTLWMGYYNKSGLVPFPTVSPFGGDTAEAAQNLTAVQSNGVVVVRTGVLDYNRTLFLSGVPAMLLPGTANMTTSAQVTAPSSQATSTVSQANASANATSPATPSSVQDYTALEAGAIAVVALVLIYLMVRSMRRSARS